MAIGSANLNIMIKAARAAGRSLVKDFREVENLQASMKGAGDFVSKADIAAQDIIKEELMTARPTYGWLAEEDAAETPGSDPTRRWIVDPLDGTTNFLHGMPHWATSIALEHKGEIVAGVIFDAAKDEMFYAEKGNGAWMNESRLRVSSRNRMIESVFASGLPHAGNKYLPAVLQDLGQVLPICAGVRRWGAAALDMAYVAAGRFDGYWERGLKPWDFAAGIVLVKEAGGLVEPIRKEQNIMEDCQVLACNGDVFDPLAKVLRKR